MCFGFADMLSSHRVEHFFKVTKLLCIYLYTVSIRACRHLEMHPLYRSFYVFVVNMFQCDSKIEAPHLAVKWWKGVEGASARTRAGLPNARGVPHKLEPGQISTFDNLTGLLMVC